MISHSLKTAPSLVPFTKSTQSLKSNPRNTQFRFHRPKSVLESLKCIYKTDSSLKFNTKPNEGTTAEFEFAFESTVSHKLKHLVTEFESLTEPIDRVKRLLHYAAVLPPLNDSARVPSNRVLGCTTQVWLDAKMDEFGKMRFEAESDSEITKGFCSCLLRIFDGAAPEEVLAVSLDDLTAMNIGVHGKAKSRVNTWHNVLVSIQKRTECLVAASSITSKEISENSRPSTKLFDVSSSTKSVVSCC